MFNAFIQFCIVMIIWWWVYEQANTTFEAQSTQSFTYIIDCLVVNVSKTQLCPDLHEAIGRMWRRNHLKHTTKKNPTIICKFDTFDFDLMMMIRWSRNMSSIESFEYQLLRTKQQDKKMSWRRLYPVINPFYITFTSHKRHGDSNNGQPDWLFNS